LAGGVPGSNLHKWEQLEASANQPIALIGFWLLNIPVVEATDAQALIMEPPITHPPFLLAKKAAQTCRLS